MSEYDIYTPDDKQEIAIWMDTLAGNSSALKQCLFPDESGCQNPAIKAHYISRQLILSQLAEDNKVISMENDLDPGQGAMGITERLQGTKQAAIFYGVCDKHDKKFADIDQKLISDYHHKRLLFYLIFRSAISYKWLSLDKRKRFQTLELRLGYPLNAAFPDSPAYILDDYLVSDIKMLMVLNRIRKRRTWDSVKHMTVPIDMGPTVAASFAIAFTESHRAIKPLLHLFVNIFPVNEGTTIILLSTLFDQWDNLAVWFQDFRTGSNQDKQSWLYHLLTLGDGYGLFFKPSFWESFDHKEELIAHFASRRFGYPSPIFFAPQKQIEWPTTPTC